jgi:hypothetical protein
VTRAPLPLTGSFWPNDRQRLLLRAALGDSEGDGAWERLRAEVDVDDPDPVDYPLLALLYRQLETLSVADPEVAKLRGIYRRTWYVNQLRRDRARDVVEATRPLEALVFDGWELVLHYYRDLGLRDVSALHLLIPQQRLEQTVRTLADLGWRRRAEARGRRPASFENQNADLCFVHLRPFGEFSSLGRGIDADDVWERATVFDFAGVPARGFGDADELLHVCLSGARMHDRPSIVWIADAIAVLRGGSVDWDRLVGQARRLRATLRAADALQFVREELAAPVPEGVVEELRRTPPRRRELLAHRAGAGRWSLVGAPPETLTRFLRLTSDASVPHAVAELPAFLREDWGLERARQVPAEAARKAAARLRVSVRAERDRRAR